MGALVGPGKVPAQDVQRQTAFASMAAPNIDPEIFAPLLKGQIAKVLVIEKRRVEGEEDQASGMPVHRLMDSLEL
jgi:hypothetical protein